MPWTRMAGVLVVACVVAVAGAAEAATAAGAKTASPGGKARTASVVTGQEVVAGEPTFSASVTADGGSLLVADGPNVRLEKTVYADRLVVNLLADGDKVTIRADASGTITVTRGNRSRTLTSGSAGKREFQQVRDLLSGSDAVSAFRTMVGVLEEDDEAPVVESTVITGALVGLLDGDFAAPARVARRIVSRHGAKVVHVALQRTAGECWDIYSREALRIADNAERCLERQRWNSLWGAACGTEFAIRAELNWFWVISCSGGLLR